MNSRDVFALALSAPGVSQLGSGQSAFASGTNFSSNGMRVRSNNFMIDGQDSNDPSVTGRQQPINNTDIIQEVRLITNQFAAEFGRAAGSIVNVATKSGTNIFRGSGFVFHNDESLNSRSNLDKRAGRTVGPVPRGEPVGRHARRPGLPERTFFFGSYQRWTDRQLGSGFTLSGAPTEAGRQVLQSAAGSRSQVAALLKFVPAGTANGKIEQLHHRRPDVHGAARRPHRLVVDRLQPQPVQRPRRPPARRRITAWCRAISAHDARTTPAAAR